MTENEVKDYLQDMITEGQIQYGDQTVPRDDEEVLKVAISALEEIQQYREIGTVEECREAMEKQKAKRPDIWGDGCSDGQLVYDMYDCPNCGKSYEIDCDDYDYCPNCGQKLYRKSGVEAVEKTSHRRHSVDCIDCEDKNHCETRKMDRAVCGCTTGKPLKSRDCDPEAGVKDNRNQNTQ